MNYTTREIAKITDSELFGDVNLRIKNIVFDSRHIYTKENTAFIAITTLKNSGEKYIPSVIEKGIKIIICEQKFVGYQGITQIVVKNSLMFLHRLAYYHLTQFPGLKTFGITGSNGKTIVKEWLYQSLCDEFLVVKSPKSFNSQLGLPLSLLQIKKTDELGIFEVGISLPGEMRKLENIFSPQIGILTHIGSAHLQNFKDLDELIKEKLLLFKNSETLIYNGDNELVNNKISHEFSSKNLISFGLNPKNDITFVSDWKDRKMGVSVSCFGTVFSFPVSKRDEATLNNVLCVIAVLYYLQFPQELIIEKINNLKAVEMRLESVEGIRNNLLINDSYLLDLDSLKIAFQFITEYKKPHKVLIITDIVETKNTDEVYATIAHLTNEQNFDKIFLIGKEIVKYQSLFLSETFSFSNSLQLLDSQEFNSLENSLILLKGARKFEIETVKTFLELQKHDTVLEINLNAILHNINVHKSFLKPETKMMAMVKAFSYGMGGYEVAEFLQYHHIDYLSVAYADEGLELRKKGIITPIMVMNPEQHSYNSIIEYTLEPEIYSFRVLDLFCEQLKFSGFHGKYPIHIKIETGMHRLGFKKDEIIELTNKLKFLPIKVMSVFSHLSTADLPDERAYSLMQIQEFENISSLLIDGLGYPPLKHILNSSGIANFSEYQFDMVRIGIGMVGISQNPSVQSQLKNAVNFKTVISQISEIEKGDSVGYGRKYRAENHTKIATIPVGYADGIPRLVGNGVGKVYIQGNPIPIIGNVCMDMIMIDIGNLDVKEGDEVVIFNSIPSLEAFSEACKTIPYEVLTSISRRVKRIYIKD